MNEIDETNYELLNGAKYFLLKMDYVLNQYPLKKGTIILKNQETLYFFSPDNDGVYMSIFGIEGKNLVKVTQDNLFKMCYTVGSEITLNNTTHTIKCFLIRAVDPDGFPDFTGFLQCEDDIIINMQDVFNQQMGGRHFRGARHFRSRKRTYKRKTKSRRKKRAF